MVATGSRPVITGTRGGVKPKGNFGVKEVFFLDSGNKNKTMCAYTL